MRGRKSIEYLHSTVVLLKLLIKLIKIHLQLYLHSTVVLLKQAEVE